MDEELLFRVLLVVIYATFFGIRIRYRVESVTRDPEQRYKLKGKAPVLLMFAILGYVISVIMWVVALPWISWFQIPLPFWIRWLGVTGAVCSLPIFLWIHRTLGRQYAAELAIQQNHVLVTVGPYSRTRHPMYTMFNVFSVSIALMSSNTLLLFFALLVVVPFLWIARMEERMLLDQFGDEYREYMERTGRFFPRLSRPKARR
ncbi:MAG: methyltransferase [Candidatus Lokiarchaeia archaeon]